MDCVYNTYSGKDLSQLHRVTLVIPTHNRNYYLSRCLWYHAHFPFAEIIIADSSDEGKRDINRQTVAEIKQMFPTKITYLEYNFPAEEYGGEIYRKWGDAVMHVETEYSLSCTDKEFLIPTTVAKSVVFLDENPDYSIADGRYYQMKSHKLIVPWQGGREVSLTNNKMVLRLYGLVNSKVPVGTQFSLQRAINHKLIYENIDKYNLYDLRFGETGIELLPIIFGKMQRNISIPMSVRDVIHVKRRRGLTKETVKSESSFSRNPPLHSYPSKRYNSMYQNLICCLKNNCSTDASLVEEITQHVFLQRYHNDKQKSNILQKIVLIRFIWENLTPYKIQYLLSKYIGSSLVQSPLKKREIGGEIKLIQNIIIRTDVFHDADKTVHKSLGVST